MTRKIGYVVVLLAVLSTLLWTAGCSPSGGGGAQPSGGGGTQPAEVQMNGDMPVGQFITVDAQQFADTVKSETGIDVKFYPAGQLYADDVAPNALSTGAMQLAQMGVGGEIEATVPETIILSGPTYTDMDWFYRFMYDKAGGGGWADAVLAPAFAKVGIKWLASMPYAPEMACMTTKQISTPADYNGLKLRAPDKGYAAVLEGNGASPVVMSSSDVYMAVQRGTIDGGVSGTTSFVSRKWYEVAKYCQTLGTGPNVQMLLANLDWWNSLDKDTQDSIWQAAKDVELKCIGDANDDQAASVQELQSNGVDVSSFAIGSTNWQQLKDNSADTVAAVMKEALTDSYDTTQQMLQATQNGTMTWQQAIDASR